MPLPVVPILSPADLAASRADRARRGNRGSADSRAHARRLRTLMPPASSVRISGQQVVRIEHHAVADEAGHAFADDARGHQVQHRIRSADDQRVTGVVAALEPHHALWRGPVSRSTILPLPSSPPLGRRRRRFAISFSPVTAPPSDRPASPVAGRSRLRSKFLRVPAATITISPRARSAEDPGGQPRRRPAAPAPPPAPPGGRCQASSRRSGWLPVAGRAPERLADAVVTPKGERGGRFGAVGGEHDAAVIVVAAQVGEIEAHRRSPSASASWRSSASAGDLHPAVVRRPLRAPRGRRRVRAVPSSAARRLQRRRRASRRSSGNVLRLQQAEELFSRPGTSPARAASAWEESMADSRCKTRQALRRGNTSASRRDLDVGPMLGMAVELSAEPGGSRVP